MPNVFYNAHLACFDVPIMAMWIACVYVYWRAEKNGGLGWALVCGVIYGLTLETKHNAWMLPARLPSRTRSFVHGRAIAATRRRHSARASRSRRRSWRWRRSGPPSSSALWPWLWNDTRPADPGVREFPRSPRVLQHRVSRPDLLRRRLRRSSYMPVMIAATVPTVTLVLFAIGAFDRARGLVARASRRRWRELEAAFAWREGEAAGRPRSRRIFSCSSRSPCRSPSSSCRARRSSAARSIGCRRTPRSRSSRAAASICVATALEALAPRRGRAATRRSARSRVARRRRAHVPSRPSP